MLSIKLFINSKLPPYLITPTRCITGLNLWHEDITSEIKHKIEKHWGEQLKSNQYNNVDATAKKYYVLSMFPYPSGSLHMGHVRVYTISDTIARFQRMNGKNVIHPIGWDSFGLPAENAAIQRRIAPDEWTANNIANMKTQLERLGCSFDWHREITTSDSSYYRWTQELFLKLYDSGLVYRKEAMVNWDPVDGTVLADEQVDENGCSWRSGAKVEKRNLRQWFVRTTEFARQLLDGLDDDGLHDWRDVIKLQRHWIGECDGVNFHFPVDNHHDSVTLWTDQPEYVQFAKFVAVKPGHVLGAGSALLNPFSGEKMPVFVTDEIQYLPLTDSFLGIPGACEQSAAFARNHNITFEPIPPLTDDETQKTRKSICEEALKKQLGGYWSSAKLRDWLISRQRFWGTPIPIVHCEKCGTQPLPRAHLPLKLPKLTKLAEKGCSPLAATNWAQTTCPKCGNSATRETDTMDTFVDSSWYYLRYLDSRNDKEMFDKAAVGKAMPVDLYIGGKEHAVLHLYYARFVAHFLHSIGLLPEREPFKRLLVQGMVMGQSYRIKGTGEYVSEDQIQVVDKKKNKAMVVATGQPVTMAWEKMSKSKHNGVDPDKMFEEYGTDTTRLLILADVAPTSHRNWNSNTFPGVLNWQKRLWLTIRDFINHRKEPPPPLTEEEFKSHNDYMYDSRNYYLKGVTFNYCGSQQHSVAISKQQGLTNSIRRMPAACFASSPQFERALACQIILLAPMAPHFASELWSGFVSAPNRLNNSEEIRWNKSVFEQKWPEIDMDYCMDLVCEINGEEAAVVKIPKSQLEQLSIDEATRLALAQPALHDELKDRDILNFVYTIVPGYDSVLNIKTNFVHRKKKEKKKKIAEV